MPKITPFLIFGGQCNHAMELYEKAFGAKVTIKTLYSQANPKDFQCNDEAEKDFVFHAEMTIDRQRIMLCDDSEGSLGDGMVARSTELGICVTFDSADEVKAAYEIMSEGATIYAPMCSTTYSSCYVNLMDKFGIRWALMTEQTKR